MLFAHDGRSFTIRLSLSLWMEGRDSLSKRRNSRTTNESVRDSDSGKLLNGSHSPDKRSCHFRFLILNIISPDELTYYANRAVVMTYKEIS